MDAGMNILRMKLSQFDRWKQCVAIDYFKEA